MENIPKPQQVKFSRKQREQIKKDNENIHESIKRAVERMTLGYSDAEVDNMHGLDNTVMNPEQYYGK